MVATWWHWACAQFSETIVQGGNRELETLKKKNYNQEITEFVSMRDAAGVHLVSR